MLLRTRGAWRQHGPGAGAWQPWVAVLALGVFEALGRSGPCRWPAQMPPSLLRPLLAEDCHLWASCPHLSISSPPCIPRNLWREVTRYLRLGDIDAATEQKRCLEEKQRVEERKRENLRTPWQPKYFIQEVTLLPVLSEGRWMCC